ncbi:MAG: hypothetical protein JRF63_06110 [Deltaproteobacteria bacterium]|nr:hypothetical protein [Deltaproteobacteria bacterium]
MKPKGSSRMPGLHRMKIAERRRIAADWIGGGEQSFPGPGLSEDEAELMIENAVGVFGVPLGIAANVVVNGVDLLVPLAIEEPSVVAAVTNAARIVGTVGGFEAEADPSLTIAQIEVLGGSPDAAARIESADEELKQTADATQPELIALGGGTRRIDVRPAVGAADRMVVHLVVDCLDAMGANMVNSLTASPRSPEDAWVCGSCPTSPTNGWRERAVVCRSRRWRAMVIRVNRWPVVSRPRRASQRVIPTEQRPTTRASSMPSTVCCSPPATTGGQWRPAVTRLRPWLGATDRWQPGALLTIDCWERSSCRWPLPSWAALVLHTLPRVAQSSCSASRAPVSWRVLRSASGSPRIWPLWRRWPVRASRPAICGCTAAVSSSEGVTSRRRADPIPARCSLRRRSRVSRRRDRST